MNSSAEQLARIVRWLVVLLLLYLIWQTYTESKNPPAPGPKTTTTEESAQVHCETHTQAPMFPAKDVPLFPRYIPTLRINNLLLGKGDGAVCAQKAYIRYEYQSAQNIAVYKSGDVKGDADAKPVEVRIGDGEVVRGLEIGLLGMQPGGKREVRMSSEYAFAGDTSRVLGSIDKASLKDSPLIALVTLDSLSPALPESELKPRVIDIAEGEVYPAFYCGDTVAFHFKAWAMDGTPLYSAPETLPLTATLGKTPLPLGLEMALSGMSRGAKRLAIIPPAYLAPLYPDARQEEGPLSHVSWPQNAMVLVEIIIPDDIEVAPGAGVKLETIPQEESKP